jgi:GT2 family glycosyltransferase
LYNENMEQTEDLELNYRLRTAGGRIMVFPDIVAWYYPSSTNLKDFFSHNIEDGVWATYPLRYGLKLSVKHFMPLVFVVAFPVAVWLYIPVLLWFSVRVAAEEKNPALFIALLAVFPARHIGYGLGSLIGLFKAFTK